MVDCSRNTLPSGLLFYFLIITLCILDIFSTEYVLREGIGFESNRLIATFISTPFFIFKLLMTTLMLFGIRKLCKTHRRLETTSYITITMFYTIIVLNNLAVILSLPDLNLSTEKLFLIFAILYTLSIPLSSKLSSNSPGHLV